VTEVKEVPKKNLLIIGAGASRGAREPSPPDGNQLLSVLEAVLKQLEGAQPESPLNFDEVPEKRGWNGIFFSKEEIELVHKFISRAIPTGKGYEGAIAEILDNDAEGGKSLLLLLNRLIAFTFCFNVRGLGPRIEGFQSGADRYDQCIDKLQISASWMAISLNYDMLFEQALFRRPLPFYYPEMNAGLVGDREGVPLFKIHGSINWFPCPTQSLHTETPTPEQKRRATTRMTWDETNRRFSIDFPDVFVSSYDLIYQELVREEELLRSPVMAHYGPRKPVDVNFLFIDGVRASALQHIEKVEQAFIIGVRPPNGDDDPILLKTFQILKGKNVTYVNPSKDDCTLVTSSFGFSTFQGTFEQWLVQI
jgi:hypothetical protein